MRKARQCRYYATNKRLTKFFSTSLTRRTKNERDPQSLQSHPEPTGDGKPLGRDLPWLPIQSRVAELRRIKKNLSSRAAPMGRQWDIRFLWKNWLARSLCAILALLIIFYLFRLIRLAFTNRPITTAVLVAVLAFAIYVGARIFRRKRSKIVKPE